MSLPFAKRFTESEDEPWAPVFWVVPEFETELRAERQYEGIQKAKRQGIKFGQTKRLNPTQIAELQARRQKGTLIKTLMHDYQLSKASVYRYLNQTPQEPPGDAK